MKTLVISKVGKIRRALQRCRADSPWAQVQDHYGNILSESDEIAGAISASGLLHHSGIRCCCKFVCNYEERRHFERRLLWVFGILVTYGILVHQGRDGKVAAGDNVKVAGLERQTVVL